MYSEVRDFLKKYIVLLFPTFLQAIFSYSDSIYVLQLLYCSFYYAWLSWPLEPNVEVSSEVYSS